MPYAPRSLRRPGRGARILCGVATLALAGVVGCATPQGSRCPLPTAAYAPWDAPAAPPPVAAETTRARATGRQVDGPADGLVAFYQRHLRTAHVPGAGCRLRPTCSVFAREAFDHYGALGLVLVVDRLFVREHASMDASYLPVCAAGAGPRVLLDPLP